MINYEKFFDEETEHIDCRLLKEHGIVSDATPEEIAENFSPAFPIVPAHLTPSANPFDISAVEIAFNDGDIKDLIELANGFIVETDDSARNGMSLALEARKLSKNIAKIRKEITDPMTQFRAKAIKLEKQYTSQLEEVEQRLLGAVGDYQDKRKITLEENNIIDPSFDTLNTELGSASVSTFYEIKIEDISLVPQKYLKIDHALAQADVKVGIRSIPGLKITAVEKRQYRLKSRRK